MQNTHKIQSPNYYQNDYQTRQQSGPSTSAIRHPASANSFMQRQPQHFPRNQINLQHSQNPPRQNFPTNSQVFKKPNNPPKPTPMSISTRNTYRMPYNGQNSAQYFNAENVEFNEPTYKTDDSEQTYDTVNCPYVYENDDNSPEEQCENFHLAPIQEEET